MRTCRSDVTCWIAATFIPTRFPGVISTSEFTNDLVTLFRYMLYDINIPGPYLLT